MATRLLVGLVLLFFGCASTPTRLEGTAGPVAWRVIDAKVVKREVAGQISDTYVAKLVLTELRGSSITFTHREQSVSDFGLQRGAPLVSTRPWVLRANGERTLPLTYSLACPNIPGACEAYATSAPRFHILLKGTSAQNEPVELSIDVTLPVTQLRVRKQ